MINGIPSFLLHERICIIFERQVNGCCYPNRRTIDLGPCWRAYGRLSSRAGSPPYVAGRRPTVMIPQKLTVEQRLLARVFELKRWFATILSCSLANQNQ